MSDWLEFDFPIYGWGRVRRGHGGILYGALSAVSPGLHGNPRVRWGLLRGHTGEEKVALHGAHLIMRCAPSEAELVAGLSGETLRLWREEALVGTPMVYALRPHATLRAAVFFASGKAGQDRSGYIDPPRFAAECQRQLLLIGVERATLRVTDEICSVPIKRAGAEFYHDGRIVVAEGLDERESLLLQTHGLGGRASYGGGFFESEQAVSAHRPSRRALCEQRPRRRIVSSEEAHEQA
jgi:CRISPR-associated protein Cas6